MALTKIKTSGIADNAITNAKMADDAIDSADFADASIDNVHVATGLDAVKLADGTVTNTELQYINTLSSNAQTQISAKLPLSGGAMTGAITTNSTFDGVDIATRDGILSSTTTTANAALPKAGGAMTGAITTNSTFDGVDIATRDGVLTSTTTTANAALPKAGGTMTGNIVMADDTSIGISDSDERIEFDASGDISFLGCNVGIGTASPENKLTVVQTENATETNITQDSDTWGVLVETGNYTADRFVGMIAHRNANKEAQTGIWSEITSSGSLMHLGTSADYDTGVNVKNMTLKYDGNVGIGTAAPSALLHVHKADSNVEIARFESTGADGTYRDIKIGVPDYLGVILRSYRNSGGGDFAIITGGPSAYVSSLFCQEDGKVGIGGITSPTAKLQIGVAAVTTLGAAASSAIQIGQATGGPSVGNLTQITMGAASNANAPIAIIIGSKNFPIFI